MPIPIIVSDVCLLNGVKVRPLASVFVESDPTDEGTFHPVGCCMTQISLPKLSRDSIVDDTCINIQSNCFDDTPAEDPELFCDFPPNTQPGPMSESEFSFRTNYVPGGLLTEWFEAMVKCGTKLRWLICYANGYRQLISCGWIKGHEPQDFESGAKSAEANIMVSICGEWSWEASGTPVT